MDKGWTIQEQVHAIHIRDLEKNLRDLGLLEKINDGTIGCFNCGEKLEIQNIQCLFMEKDQIKVCCSKVDCFENVLLSKQEGENE